MHENKQMKIDQLQPSMSGFCLTFEINQIISCQQNPQQLHCRIVDDTGIINAFFNQYTKYFKVGSVYKAAPLKTKVVNFHLQIELMLNTTIEKEPFLMGFKDKENDLSIKYYALKEELLKIGQKDTFKLTQPKIDGPDRPDMKGMGKVGNGMEKNGNGMGKNGNGMEKVGNGVEVRSPKEKILNEGKKMYRAKEV